MYNKTDKTMRIAALLPKALREARGRATILPACAETKN
jgi:hypothetical protein